jgi:AcrR family transcriptional regulator
MERVKKIRQRRTPEDARRLLLQAGELVLGQKGPEKATLRDVADAAGVSHALITHYFKTFDGLVDAVFEVLIARMWTATIQAQKIGVQRVAAIDVLRSVLAFMNQPIHRTLATSEFLRDGGVRFNRSRVDWFKSQKSLLQEQLGLPCGPRSDGLVLYCIAAIYGFSIGGHGLSVGIGLTQAQGESQFLELLASSATSEIKKIKSSTG